MVLVTILQYEYYCNTKARTQLTACIRDKHNRGRQATLDDLPNIGTEFKTNITVRKGGGKLGVVPTREYVLLLTWMQKQIHALSTPPITAIRSSVVSSEDKTVLTL